MELRSQLDRALYLTEAFRPGTPAVTPRTIRLVHTSHLANYDHGLAPKLGEATDGCRIVAVEAVTVKLGPTAGYTLDIGHGGGPVGAAGKAYQFLVLQL